MFILLEFTKGKQLIAYMISDIHMHIYTCVCTYTRELIEWFKDSVSCNYNGCLLNIRQRDTYVHSRRIDVSSVLII